MEIINVFFYKIFIEFVLGTPEKPSQEIQKKDNSDEPGPINTNSYLVVKYFKSNKKTIGFPMSNKYIDIETNNIIKLGRV
jgi:hypothetical protein